MPRGWPPRSLKAEIRRRLRRVMRRAAPPAGESGADDGRSVGYPASPVRRCASHRAPERLDKTGKLVKERSHDPLPAPTLAIGFPAIDCSGTPPDAHVEHWCPGMPPGASEPEHLTLPEAAEMLGMLPATLERWARAQRIPSGVDADGKRNVPAGRPPEELRPDGPLSRTQGVSRRVRPPGVASRTTGGVGLLSCQV
jgi:hypothetical protein